jgi:hypothetical protein
MQDRIPAGTINQTFTIAELTESREYEKAAEKFYR